MSSDVILLPDSGCFTGFLGRLPSMYGIFVYIWMLFMVNVGKCTIRGCYGGGEKIPSHFRGYEMVMTRQL